MKLYSIQPIDVWEALQQESVLIADPTLGEHVMMSDPKQDFFLKSYDWMRQQMKLRLDNYRGNWPWWAWHTWMTLDDGTAIHKPDLRTIRWQHTPGQYVRLELNIPDEQVLLSCFDGWHGPLNNHYLAWDEADEESFDAQYDAIRPQKYTLRDVHEGNVPPLTEEQQIAFESLQRRKEESWQRCFDLHWMRGSFYNGADMVQACFEELRLDQVVKCTIFEGARI